MKQAPQRSTIRLHTKKKKKKKKHKKGKDNIDTFREEDNSDTLESKITAAT